MENHDEAYHVWRQAGISQRVLVHVDAHHDMAWLGGEGHLDIGNYVCQAITDGCVREVYWVVPEASWASTHTRRALRHHLRKLARDYGSGQSPITTNGLTMSTFLGPTRLMVCVLESLPTMDEPVLLDLDVDFLLIPSVGFWEDDRPSAVPWIWPEAVAAALEAKQVCAEVVTIAYSVVGGYTPLQWKFLGDELASMWPLPEEDLRTSREAFRALKDAAVSHARGDLVSARSALEKAIQQCPDLATLHYNLALRYLSAGHLPEARHSFERAVGLDPSYGAQLASRGFVCLKEERTEEAHEEFARALALFPHSGLALLGMARLAVLDRDWALGESFLRQAIDAQPRLVDAHRYLGDTLVALSRDAEAGVAYSRCLKLALEGEVSIEEAIHTAAWSSGPRDSRHGRIHAALAAIDARAGRRQAAIAGYRMAVAAGADRVPTRLKLAWQYAWQGQLTGTASEVAAALKQIPKRCRHSVLEFSREAMRWRANRRRPPP